MIIIIGLGNPGQEFEETRHNVGFMAVDQFAKENDFPGFGLEKKYEALVSEQKKVLLAKPQTFMNNSGKAAKKIAAVHKKADVMVIHDDMDLPLGKIKIVYNRGSAGHKGVESVIKAIGNKNLARIRVGIAPERSAGKSAKKPKKPETFVVGKFTGEEQKIVKKTLKKIIDALDAYVTEGLERAMNEYNR